MVASGADITEREKRDLLGRVLQSPSFSSSRAMQAFLQFITDHAISGDVDAIKEQRIGSEVLGRKGDYDPAADNIVRVRAHELRQRLAKHFSTDGAAEPIIITIPKGSYVPAFVPRPTAAPPPDAATAPPPVPKSRGVPPWIPWSVAGILAIVLAFQVLTRPAHSTAANTGVASSAAIRDLWEQMFRDNDHDVTAVSADSCFALWQDITGQNIELGDYITRKFVQLDKDNPKLGEVASRLCTSPADITVALGIGEVSRAFHGHLRHVFSRDLTPGQLRTGNAVLIGSRRSNPWVGLFESRMNFVLEIDNQDGPHFRNKSPRPGEAVDFAIPSRFDSAGTEKQQMVSYAVAALVPNLSGTGFVLIVEGLSMEGTAAVGDVVTNPEKLAVLLRKLGHKPGTPVKPFEALMRLTSIPGGFAYPEMISARYPNP